MSKKGGKLKSVSTKAEVCPVCQSERTTDMVKSFCDPYCGHKACIMCWRNYSSSTLTNASSSIAGEKGKSKCPECCGSFAQLELAFVNLEEGGSSSGGAGESSSSEASRRPVAASHSERVKNGADCLFHDSRNLAVNNLPEWLRDEQELARWDFFGQYGQIVDILIPSLLSAGGGSTGGGGVQQHRSRRAVIRYETADAARTAMRCAGGAVVSIRHPKLVGSEIAASEKKKEAASGASETSTFTGAAAIPVPKVQVCSLGVSLHPTRYCSYFLLAKPCEKDQCVELHAEVLPPPGPMEAGSLNGPLLPEEATQQPRMISKTGADYLPMVNYFAASAYIEKQLSESGTITTPSTPTTSSPTAAAAGGGSAASSVMDLINPNRQQKLSAGARPFIPGVGGMPVIPSQSSLGGGGGGDVRETRVSTWQGVLTEEMALMAQIQSLRKDHTRPDWETAMFEPAVFPFTRGLALPSPAHKDSVDDKMMAEHRLHKAVDVSGSM